MHYPNTPGPVSPAPPPPAGCGGSPVRVELRLVSSHARVRMKRRGITQRQLELLLAYGEVRHDHYGGKIVLFDEAAHRRLAADRPEPEMDRCLGMYAVLDREDEVITVGHRSRRKLCAVP